MGYTEAWTGIPCSPHIWVELISKLNESQRCKVREWGFGSLLEAKYLKMRLDLLKYMIGAFDPDHQVFNIGSDQITLVSDDVEAIMGLKNHGHKLNPLNTDRSNDIPSNFVDGSTNKIAIDQLMTDIEFFGSADDDFIRRVILVLLGTLLIPVSTRHIPTNYYAIVMDASRAKNINWVYVTLSFLMSSLSSKKKGICKPAWPGGNLVLLQYLYWAKVRPLSGFDSYCFASYPLMTNWDEKIACKRDEYDQQNGCGHGRIVNDIKKYNSKDNGVDGKKNKTNIPEAKNLNETRKQRVSPTSKKIHTVLEEVQRKISNMEKHVAPIPSIMKYLEDILHRLEKNDASPNGVEPDAHAHDEQHNSFHRNSATKPASLSESTSFASEAANVPTKMKTVEEIEQQVQKNDDAHVQLDSSQATSATSSSTSVEIISPNIAQRVKRDGRKRCIPSKFKSSLVWTKKCLRDASKYHTKTRKNLKISLFGILCDLTRSHIEAALDYIDSMSPKVAEKILVFSNGESSLWGHQMTCLSPRSTLFTNCEIINAYVEHMSTIVGPDGASLINTDRFIHVTWKSELLTDIFSSRCI